MAKLRLLVWMVGLAAAAVALLGSAAWPGSDDPALAVMTVVRVVAGVLAVYLLSATVLSLGWRRAVGPAIVRRLVAGAISGGLLLAPMTASASTDVPPGVEVPVLHRIPEPEARSGDVAGADPPRARHQNPVGDVEEVTVAPGDHLWAIAERTLAGRLGRAPSDAEVVPYWTALIELNRDRLATADPDLIFAGQRFRLPS